MSLFRKHLARARRAEDGLDHEQDKAVAENEKDDMPIMTEASLPVQAEDEDEDEYLTAESEEGDEDKDKEEEKVEASQSRRAEDDADSDKVVEEVAEAVEEELEDLVDEVKAALKAAKASPRVVAATIRGLQTNGFIIENPYRVDPKRAALTAREAKIVRQIVEAATASAEDILRVASTTLIKHKRTRRHARALDRRLKADGYLRSCVAEPTVLGTVRSAERAKEKTRSAKRKSGLSLR